MPFTLTDFLLGFLLPLVVAWGICAAAKWWSVRRECSCAGERSLARFAAPLALLVGFSAGYYSLGLGPIVPRFDRDWLAIAAWFAFPAAGLLATEPSKTKAAIAIAAAGIVGLAFLLVPTWESVLPAITQYRLAFCAGAFALFSMSMHSCSRLDRIAERKPEIDSRADAWVPLVEWLCVLLMLFACSALMALSGSLGFATVAIAALGAGVGLLVVLASWGDTFGIRITSLVPVWTFLVSSLAFTAQVNSSTSIPIAAYVILPFAPAIGTYVLPRYGNPVRRRHLLLSLILCGMICGVAMGLAIGAQWDSLTSQQPY
ncbi:MAG: hypothetical protein Aurels2KO_54410 [Aureliella sp.]